MKAAEVQSVPADRHARMVLAIVLHRKKDIVVEPVSADIEGVHYILMIALVEVIMV